MLVIFGRIVFGGHPRLVGLDKPVCFSPNRAPQRPESGRPRGSASARAAGTGPELLRCVTCLCPNLHLCALLPFLGAGSPTKIDYKKKGPLIPSPLEDLGIFPVSGGGGSPSSDSGPGSLELSVCWDSSYIERLFRSNGNS